jgi:hypothetical protein
MSVEGLDLSNETNAIHKVDRHARAIRTHGVQKSILLLRRIILHFCASDGTAVVQRALPEREPPQ